MEELEFSKKKINLSRKPKTTYRCTWAIRSRVNYTQRVLRHTDGSYASNLSPRLIPSDAKRSSYHNSLRRASFMNCSSVSIQHRLGTSQKVVNTLIKGQLRQSNKHIWKLGLLNQLHVSLLTYDGVQIKQHCFLCVTSLILHLWSKRFESYGILE